MNIISSIYELEWSHPGGTTQGGHHHYDAQRKCFDLVGGVNDGYLLSQR
jgi:hypothetical protein